MRPCTHSRQSPPIQKYTSQRKGTGEWIEGKLSQLAESDIVGCPHCPLAVKKTLASVECTASSGSPLAVEKTPASVEDLCVMGQFSDLSLSNVAGTWDAILPTPTVAGTSDAAVVEDEDVAEDEAAEDEAVVDDEAIKKSRIWKDNQTTEGVESKSDTKEKQAVKKEVNMDRSGFDSEMWRPQKLVGNMFMVISSLKKMNHAKDLFQRIGPLIACLENLMIQISR